MVPLNFAAARLPGDTNWPIAFHMDWRKWRRCGYPVAGK